MLTFTGSSEKKKNKICLLCNEKLNDVSSFPDICHHLFHYKCLRTYTDKKLDKKEPVLCPEKGCRKFFGRIANKYKNSDELIYQNVLLTNDENQCCICFLKYKIPVASSDSCSHSFCCECLKKWCTFKHECPMDRVPIKMLLISDFPGGHITSKMEPPPVEQDLNGDGDNDELVNTTCEVCNSGQDEHQLLLCDNCNRGYHIYCLPVPLSNIPEGDWFCSQCEQNISNSQDEITENGGLLRGLGRIIDNIQGRHAHNNTENNTQRRRNTANNRRAASSARAVRDTRLEDFIVESEDEWTPDEDALPTLVQESSPNNDNDLYAIRTRNRIGQSRVTRGVRTRSGRRLEDSNEEVIVTRPRRPVNAIDSDQGSDNALSLRARNLQGFGQQPAEESISETVTQTSNLRNLRNVQRRRRQGSLSSDIESEAEPIRKRRRLHHGHYSQLTEDEDEIKSSTSESSSEEETQRTPSPITTRLRARENQEREESPVRPPTKLSRIIAEDSDEEQLTDEQHLPCGSGSSSGLHKKKRLIIASDSSQDESEDERVRHLSTSSSLSTIPCRISDVTEMIAEVKRKPGRQAGKSRAKKVVKQLQDDLSASTSDGTVDERDDTWRPSTSSQINSHNTRRSKRKSSSNPTRRSSRPRKPKRGYKEDSDDYGVEKSPPHRVRGRENHGREEPCVLRDRSFNSSGSILSEINNDSQNVLRHKSHSSSSSQAKKEKLVLTIKHLHVTNSNNSALETIYHVLPHNNTTQIHDLGPSTSSSSSSPKMPITISHRLSSSSIPSVESVSLVPKLQIVDRQESSTSKNSSMALKPQIDDYQQHREASKLSLSPKSINIDQQQPSRTFSLSLRPQTVDQQQPSRTFSLSLKPQTVDQQQPSRTFSLSLKPQIVDQQQPSTSSSMNSSLAQKSEIVDHEELSTSSSRNFSLAPKSQIANHEEPSKSTLDPNSQIVDQLQPSTSSSKNSSLTSKSVRKSHHQISIPKDDIVKLVSSVLHPYLTSTTIDKAEFTSLNDRIVEKIITKSGEVYQKSKIKKFVNKYMAFFLSRRNKTTNDSGNNGANGKNLSGSRGGGARVH